MSLHGNDFDFTGTLWGESIGDWWIPLTKGQWCEVYKLLVNHAEVVEKTVILPRIVAAMVLMRRSSFECKSPAFIMLIRNKTPWNGEYVLLFFAWHVTGSCHYTWWLCFVIIHKKWTGNAYIALTACHTKIYNQSCFYLTPLRAPG